MLFFKNSKYSQQNYKATKQNNADYQFEKFSFTY